MIISEDDGQQEKAKAEALIAETPIFDGVDRIHVELGEDHDGDPSMWLVFHLRPGLNVDVSWIRAYNDYSTKLGLKLIHSGLARFPYTRLEPAA